MRGVPAQTRLIPAPAGSIVELSELKVELTLPTDDTSRDIELEEVLETAEDRASFMLGFPLRAQTVFDYYSSFYSSFELTHAARQNTPILIRALTESGANQIFESLETLEYALSHQNANYDLSASSSVQGVIRLTKVGEALISSELWTLSGVLENPVSIEYTAASLETKALSAAKVAVKKLALDMALQQSTEPSMNASMQAKRILRPFSRTGMVHFQ